MNRIPKVIEFNFNLVILVKLEFLYFIFIQKIKLFANIYWIQIFKCFVYTEIILRLEFVTKLWIYNKIERIKNTKKSIITILKSPFFFPLVVSHLDL